MSSEGQSAQPVTTAPPLLNGRYELGERLAEGTFFYTHRGRDVQTGRNIAIKVLKPEYAADEAFASRLLNESQAAVSLSHPNIAQVYEAWRERGTVVIATEWIRGINLEDRIRRVAPFPLAVAADIFQACAEGLHYAHESGFIHGDVRPDNVIITPEGHVKLTDFGVGASVAASTRIQLTALQRAAYYLAPEIVEGHAPDARTDVYSLGCILFEMLAGKVPFAAETPIAVAAKHLHEPVPSLQGANAAVPNAVDGIARKCMQKEPRQRYITLSALLQDVRKVQEGMRSQQPLTWSPFKAPPEPAPAPPERPRSERPRPARTRANGPESPEQVAAAALTARQRARRPEPEYEPEPEADSGPSAKLLAGIALLAVLLFVGCFVIVTMMTRAPMTVTVPGNIVGMSQASAMAELLRRGLKAEVKSEYRPDSPEGTVYEIVPPGGTEIRAGKTVNLYVSKGAQPVTVPDVIGKPREEAQKLLREAGLVPGLTKEEYSEGFPKGEVMGQSPFGGTEAPKSSPVTLTVSKGSEPTPTIPETTDSTPADTGPDSPSPMPETSPPDAPNPAATATPNPDLPRREHVVTVEVPRKNSGPQHVQIIVHNEDGTEQTAHDQEHEPGETIEETVTTWGHPGKCQIRVFINGKPSKPIVL